jgi:hypothetical protein
MKETYSGEQYTSLQQDLKAKWEALKAKWEAR